MAFYINNFNNDRMGDILQEFINFTLHYIADLDIPIKRLVRFRG